MLKISVPKIVRDLDLGGYADELAGQRVQVWVNPPREKVLAYSDIMAEIDGFDQQIADLHGRISEEPEKVDELTEQIDALAERVEKANDALFAWYAEIWSQGDEKESAESVREFATSTMDTDPALWRWVAQSTVLMIADHRRGEKKG